MKIDAPAEARGRSGTAERWPWRAARAAAGGQWGRAPAPTRRPRILAGSKSRRRQCAPTSPRASRPGRATRRWGRRRAPRRRSTCRWRTLRPAARAAPPPASWTRRSTAARQQSGWSRWPGTRCPRSLAERRPGPRCVIGLGPRCSAPLECFRAATITHHPVSLN